MKLRSKRVITYDNPVNVFDITISDKTPCFLLDNGIVSHNTKRWKSPIHTIPWGCFTYDTLIEKGDGTFHKIGDLVGQEFIVKSFSTENDLPSLGYAHNVRYTKDAEIIEIKLENGKSFKCTENHLILLKDGTYKEAGKLSILDELEDM